MGERITIGTLEELRRTGCLTGKAGTQPICVFWSDGAPFAVDDRCPHMGFPLHRGTVESGLLTCHWHNARFDLRSGGTLDPWADDVRAYPVEIDDGRVIVVVDARARPHGPPFQRGWRTGWSRASPWSWPRPSWRCSTPASAPRDIVRAGVDFGTRYRDGGWGAGLTVLTAMANVLAPPDAGGPAAGAGRTAWRSCPATPAAGRPGSRCCRCGGDAAGRAAGRLVPPLRRDPVGRRRRADAGLGRATSAAAATDCRRHHVRRRHRPRLPRRRAHHRLHQQGVRGARPPRLGRRRRRAPDARRPDRGGQPQRGARRLALPPRPRRR